MPNSKVQSYEYVREQAKAIKLKILENYQNLSLNEMESAIESLIDFTKIGQQFMRCFVHEFKNNQSEEER